MPTPHIGVLAGMGPRSTAPFIDRLVDECQRQYGATHDLDFPPMLIYALPTPFYLDRPLDHAALAGCIQAGLERLAGSGVALLAMPCNSAHRYYARLAGALAVPLLNMVELAVAALPPAARRVALLATRSTVEGALYQPALAAAGRACYHSQELQVQVDALIGAIKRGPPAQARPRWRALLGLLEAARVDAALLACTDLNALQDSTPAPCALVDATGALAQETIRRWHQLCEYTREETT